MKEPLVGQAPEYLSQRRFLVGFDTVLETRGTIISQNVFLNTAFDQLKLHTVIVLTVDITCIDSWAVICLGI
jgi:hypothetical protein